MSLSNPLDSRLQLGAELRRLRKAKGMTMREVADFLDCSEPRISRLETGKLTGATLKAGELRRLATLFDVQGQGAVDELLHLLSETEQTAWWEPYEDVLPSGMDSLLGLQTAATHERALETVLVHGLLQTSAYARAVLEEVGIHSPSAIDRLVALRARRPEVLHRTPNPLELEVLLDEAVLRRPVGGRDVMRAQLEAIARATELPNVTVLVVPSERGAHAGLSGAFSLIAAGDQNPVAYVDSPAGNLLLHKDRDVEQLTGIYNRVRAKALDEDGTLRFITRVIEET
ncbi:helix-turn-helix transcriptional regulator (plasmid) [Kitasatospora sp. NBC_00070]|uniref:helix-turn-helix domain-containing protein n=1 Tax=Kitasatospora sp. NBC_00070 TaxID=2975962 RepID=UPI002F9092C4